MNSLCIGILAHVDAGKTSLTERLLYAAGVIDEIGSVDDGTTQTDTLALERRRGLTIKSAVVSFDVHDTTVNLIDTPGHPDFIAEVERVLSVLDGAVLVISAVEGVQAQTRVLMRALQRLRIPTIIFVNKIDRTGAQDERTLEGIAGRLTRAIIPMGSVYDVGKRDAGFTPCGTNDGRFIEALVEKLAEQDDSTLALYLDDEVNLTYDHAKDQLAAQTSKAQIYPVFFGSAITGAGVDSLVAGIAELLPAGERASGEPAVGTVFKVERGPSAEKIAYVRMFSGVVRTRGRVRIGDDADRKVTGIRLFQGGSCTASPTLAAGQIGKLWGLDDVRIGDLISSAAETFGGRRANHERSQARRGREHVIVGRNGRRQASPQSAELDPSYQAGYRSTRSADELAGAHHFTTPTHGLEVRRQIEAPTDGAKAVPHNLALTDEFMLSRQFAPPTLETVVVPKRAEDKGALHLALVQLSEQDPLINVRQDDSRQEISLSLYGEVQKEVIQETLASEYQVEVDFRETTTICIERPVGTGSAFEIIGKAPNPFAATVGLRVDPAAFDSGIEFRLEVELGSIPLSFHKAVEETVRETLRQGLFGWEVMDCTVTMTHSGYWSPVSTAGDFRNLTPLVLMDALRDAKTSVFDPMHRFQLEIPHDTYGATASALSKLEAAVCEATTRGSAWVLEGEIPAARVHELQQILPGLSRGEGMVECEFGRYRPIKGTVPNRPRLDDNPLNRKEYLLHVRRRV